MQVYFGDILEKEGVETQQELREKCKTSDIIFKKCDVLIDSEVKGMVILKTQKKFKILNGGHGGAVVRHSPPNSEVSSSNPGPYVGKLLVAYLWFAVYSTEF